MTCIYEFSQILFSAVNSFVKLSLDNLDSEGKPNDYNLHTLIIQP